MKWHADNDYVFDEEGNVVAQVRGWGRLTGKGAGGLGLSDEDAFEVQKSRARLIAAAPEMYTFLTDFLDYTDLPLSYYIRRAHKIQRKI